MSSPFYATFEWLAKTTTFTTSNTFWIHSVYVENIYFLHGRCASMFWCVRVYLDLMCTISLITSFVTSNALSLITIARSDICCERMETHAKKFILVNVALAELQLYETAYAKTHIFSIKTMSTICMLPTNKINFIL